MPGVRAVRSYEPAWLSRDLIAGVVLVTLLVPQGMAYAELAGLPTITGLYTTVVCLLAYAIFGPSRILVLGPDSSLGPMIAATILPLAAGNPDTAVALAGMLALMVGVITVATGIARFGFVADLLSNPVRVGYLAGLAVVIFVGQLPKLFGFSTDASGFFGEVVAFVEGLDQTNVWALGIGLVSLILIVGLGRLLPRLPGILIAVVVAIGLSIGLDLAAHGVSVIGVLPQGFPVPALPQAGFGDLPLLFAGALGISLVAIGDTISTSGGFAARSGDEVDGNQELLGIGSANLAAGLFSGFAVSTSGSRTAVAAQSGARTQLTGVVAAVLVLLMLLFVPGLVRDMPQPTLAAVIIAASISLVDVSALRRLFSVRRTEFVLAAACSLGVIFYGVLPGIVLAVVLSMLNVFRHAWTPHSAILGESPGVSGFHSISDYPDARQIPGLLIVRWSAPLFFANANQFRDLVRRLVKEHDGPLRWVLVAAAPVTDIDTTAGSMLSDLDVELNAAGISLAFAELQTRVRDRIVRYGLLETIDAGHFYRSVSEGVEAFRAETGSPA
jgi:high affinity sulfate transporter 1